MRNNRAILTLAVSVVLLFPLASWIGGGIGTYADKKTTETMLRPTRELEERDRMEAAKVAEARRKAKEELSAARREVIEAAQAAVAVRVLETLSAENP